MTVEPDRDDAAPRSDRRTPLALALLAAVVHLWLARHMVSPTVHSDEFGYLANARYLVDGGQPPLAVFHPGYSLVLVPLAAVIDDAYTYYRVALALNALLAGVGVLLVWALVGVLAPGLTHSRRTLVTILVASYPPYLLASNLALAENLYVPAFLVVVLLVARAQDHAIASPGRWAAAGASAGALYLVHPRALAVVAALVLFATLTLRPLRDHRAAFGGLLAGVVAALAASHALVVYVTRDVPQAAVGDGAFETIAKNLSPAELVDLVVGMSGQILYLSVATVGLFPLGMLVAGRATWRALRGNDTAVHRTVAFIGIAVIASVVLSSMYMNGGVQSRLDKLIYGRYNEGVLAPVLVLGLVLATGGLRGTLTRVTALRLASVAGAVVVITGLAVALGHSDADLRLPLVAPNVMGIDVLLVRRGLALDVGFVVAVSLATIAVAVAGFRRALGLGAAALLACFAIDTNSAYAQLNVGSKDRARQRTIAHVLVAARDRLGLGLGCVAYDLDEDSLWHRYNYRLFLPGVEVASFRPSAGERPCGPLVITGSWQDGPPAPGARLVVPENSARQSLWVLTGATQRRLERAGWLIPADFPSALPDAAQHSRTRLVDHTGPIRVDAGKQVRLRLEVSHRGRGAPWPNSYALGIQTDSVRLVARWYPLVEAGGLPTSEPVAAPRFELPRPVLPGESVEVDADLAAVASDGAALSPGRYVVVVGPVQEERGLFEQTGDLGSLRLTVYVD